MGTWETVPLPPGSNGVGIFAVDPKDPDRLFASIVRLPTYGCFAPLMVALFGPPIPRWTT